MTLDALNTYRWIMANIEAINEEIRNLYNPISSPNGRETIGAFGNNPSNPTEKNALRVLALREKLETRQQEMLELREEIEQWLMTIEDAELEAIIRCHFLLSMSWRATSIRVYGYPSPDRARKKVERFLKKN